MPSRRMALLTVDPQNDFCSPGGVYERRGIDIEPIRRILPPLAELMQFCQQSDIPTILTQFTILTDRHGRPLAAQSLLSARPFLAEEGFRTGTWGHAIADELPPPDFLIEKTTFSAFYATRLDFLLDQLGVNGLVICGVGTNGAVESTLRDAQLRGLEILLITDCTAAFNPELHETSLKSMAGLSRLISSRQVRDAL